MKNLVLATLALFFLVPGTAGAEELVIETPTGPLAGSLLVPAGEGPWPVVLILAGSGPTDRDGNSTMFPGRNNSLKQLAEGLATAGIASLRVDKRGVAGSTPAALGEIDLTFDVFIDDAARWCRWLQSDDRFSSLTVAGHSQGAQVGAAAAWRSDADGYVSMAGPGRPIIPILREQLAAQLPIRSRVAVNQVLDELALGRVVDEVPAGLDMILRPSVQPFLISWNRRDPVKDLARLPLPVLVLQGTDDIQITVTDAENLATARPGSRLVLVEGMNHLMKEVPREETLGQQMSLVDATLLIMPEAVDAVVDLAWEANAQAPVRAAARKRALAAASQAERIEPMTAEDELLASEQGQPTPERIGAWARRFLEADEVVYLFGPAEGGYVAEGALVSDQRQDCVSLLYRVSELAQARDHEDALDWALRTRFAGAVLDSVVGPDGQLDYDAPVHLDYSLDMIHSGMWGFDVTRGLAGATIDTVGTSRYPAGSFEYVPTAELDPKDLNEGDIAWFVLNPAHEGAANLREEYGLVIGHIGILIVDDGRPWLVHAARSDLEGWYEGGTVVKVPLVDYLARVDRFAGIIVTRY
jgi:pimeloyl-ACP methyl ester carboxylesterase